ncbi:hypothetical protein T310_5074, partial [Rasamsonia emersonii CBS 393.64]
HYPSLLRVRQRQLRARKRLSRTVLDVRLMRQRLGRNPPVILKGHSSRHYQSQLWPSRNSISMYVLTLSLLSFAVIYHMQKEYLCEAFLGIDKDSVRHEVGRVVRSVKTNDEYKSRPYMVGPRGHGFAEAILLIRPFRKGLSPEGGFFWAYEGSHTLSPLEFERRRQEGSLKLVPLSVELGQVLVLFSTLWVEFPESHRDVSDTFVCRGYKHQITKPVIDPNLPGYVSDDDVLPFMRLARR